MEVCCKTLLLRCSGKRNFIVIVIYIYIYIYRIYVFKFLYLVFPFKKKKPLNSPEFVPVKGRIVNVLK